nr:AAA family ATPase [Rhizobiaceae bacterium]
LASNARAALSGADADRLRSLNAAAAQAAMFSAAAYLLHAVEGDVEPDAKGEPPLAFDTPFDGLKSLVAGLDAAVAGSADDAALVARARGLAEQVIEMLLARRGRFSADLGAFESAKLSVERDGFTLDGFDAAPGRKAKPLAMSFKKPEEIIGNHLAKRQAMRLARMIVAYDVERQMNPFVELGGFLFTFIGDGAPGTGKTILIQMTAGLIHQYCQVAGLPFHYENFGADQISSYQGKSGQNCRAFINNVTNPRMIGFGTIDDVDQVAAQRSDDRASAGQHEITAVLMDAFAGASTVVRGNATFGMFSNYPEKVDDALRQRAGGRWQVDGPQTRDDYIDILALLAGKNHRIPLGEHDLFAAQDITRAVAEAYGEHDRPQEPELVKVVERHVKEHGAPQTLAEVGAYLHAIKAREPRFTGRAIKNITDAVKMRAMDFDMPDEWFETPEPFLSKDYDTKKAMISELRQPFTLAMLMQEIHRYADSEFRYAGVSDARAVERMVHDAKLRERAISEVERLKEEGKW